MSSCQVENLSDPGPDPTEAREDLGIYIHIPFCRTRCLYCDFNSVARPAPPWRDYGESLETELEHYADTPLAGRSLETLFIGGGTPSLCPPPFFDRLFHAVFRRFPPGETLELTVECNPGTIGRADLRQLRSLGVNRLSLGIQSFADRHLRTLTRIHDRTQALAAIEDAAHAGFEEISIDLIWGIPGQSPADWEDDLRQTVALPLTHCATYGLTVYEGTRLARQVTAGALALPGESTLVEMYHAAEDLLGRGGFRHYEISNWSRAHPCRHNLRYWQGKDWIGIGAGAHSYTRRWCLESDRTHPVRLVPAPHGGRWWTEPNPDRYMAACATNRSVHVGREVLSRQQAMTETLMMGLRTACGLDLGRFRHRFGASASEHLLARAAHSDLKGLVQTDNTRLHLTPGGFLLSDRVILELSLAADQGLAHGTGTP